MRFAILAALFGALACAAAQAQEIPEGFRKAWPDFRYVEPGQLRALPDAVRSDLERRGCRIPRFMKWDGPHNAIQGQFMQAGQQDWAVLCATPARTSLLVYPAGLANAVKALRAEDPDPRRFIHTVSAFVLGKRAARDQQGEMPVRAFDHDGIEDGQIGHGGRVLYHREGEWSLL